MGVVTSLSAAFSSSVSSLLLMFQGHAVDRITKGRRFSIASSPFATNRSVVLWGTEGEEEFNPETWAEKIEEDGAAAIESNYGILTSRWGLGVYWG